MPVLTISDPESGKSHKVELEDARMSSIVGRRIGEVLDGSFVNLSGHKIQLTGGTDKDGIPMRPDVHGGVKAKIILSRGVGYRRAKKGERKRVVVRGNTVTVDTNYLNFKIVEKPKEKKRKAESKSEKKSEPKKVE